MKKFKIFAFASIAIMMTIIISVFGVKAQSVEVSNTDDFLAVIETGGKIKLTSDLDFGEFTGKKIQIAADTKVTIDLNGYTISGKVTNEKTSSALIQNNGTLTIEDNSETGTGKITLTDNGVALGSYSYGIFTINNEGTLEVNSGTIENTGTTDVPYSIDNNTTSRNATVTINGGTIVANKAAIRAFCNSTKNENKIIIKGGNITAGNSAVWISQVNKKANKGYLEITGGTIYGQKYNGVYISVFEQSTMSNMSVKITGGTIKNNSETAATFTYEYWTSPEELANAVLNLEITGGTFINENENGRAFYNPDFLEIPVTYTNITGGSYTTDISEYVKTGYVTRLIGDLYVVGTEYNIVAENVKNGAVTLDKTKAIAGETVTVTVTLNEEYELESIKVVDAENNEITLTDGAFTMPNSDVTITVDLKQIKYVVNTNGLTNGEFTVDKTESAKGETVTVTVTPDAEYELDEIVVVDENDNEVTVTDGAFTMPSGNVTVSVQLKQIKYNVLVEEVTNGVVDITKTTAAKGETVAVSATPEEGYELVSIKVVDAENNETIVPENGIFTMPSGDVTVKVTFAKIEYTINVDELENGTISVDKKVATMGETVTITATANEGYELVSIKVVDEKNNEITITDNKFTMPIGNVTVIVELADIRHTVKVNALENGTVSVDKKEADRGDTVTITVTPDAGYELVSIKVVDEENNEITITDGKFVMPNSEVTVTVSLADIRHTVKLDALANGTVSVDKKEADRGETVTVTVTPNAGYELVSIKVVDADKNEITITDGKFVMPNSEVTVSVTLLDIRHTVKVNTLENGTVSVDKEEADRGDTVTVTVTPNAEYKLVSIKVLDEENNEITITDNKFTMPNSEVTVTVELAQIKYAANVTETTNGTVGVSKTQAVKGETVTVTVTPEEGYELSSIKVVDKDNKEVTLTNDTFVMPSGGVTVSAEFSKITYATEVKPIDPTEEVEEVEVGVKESEELNDVLLDSLTEILKDEENQELASIVGTTSTKVEVEISKLDEETIDEEIVEEIQEKAGKATIATFFDIEVLIKTAKEEQVLGRIDELTKEIELMILLPEELKNTDKDVNRNYFIVRKHGTRIDTLPATLSEDGNHLIFKSKEFSTYALAYEDTTNPQTYDGIGLYVILGTLSLISLVGISIIIKRKKLFN